MGEFAELIKSLGYPLALIVFLIWWVYGNQKKDQQEKEELAQRLNKVEDYQKEKLETLVTSAVTAIEKNTATQSKLVEALNLRPCISGRVKAESGAG